MRIDCRADDESLSFWFEAPSRPLSENESRKIHWATRRNRLKPWKEATAAAWLLFAEFFSHNPELREAWISRPGTVLVTLPFDRTEAQWEADRRDPHNYVGTMCKVIVDQLTDKKTGSIKRGDVQIETRLWPDDTPDFVEVLEPKLVRGKTAEVRITPRS